MHSNKILIHLLEMYSLLCSLPEEKKEEEKVYYIDVIKYPFSYPQQSYIYHRDFKFTSKEILQ